MNELGWSSILQNSWLLAVGTFLFFAIKGCLWLAVPALVVRWRKRIWNANSLARHRKA
jgi:hypothetical protein